MLIHLGTIRSQYVSSPPFRKEYRSWTFCSINCQENFWFAQKRCQKTYFFPQDRRMRENSHPRGGCRCGFGLFFGGFRAGWLIAMVDSAVKPPRWKLGYRHGRLPAGQNWCNVWVVLTGGQTASKATGRSRETKRRAGNCRPFPCFCHQK